MLEPHRQQNDRAGADESAGVRYTSNSTHSLSSDDFPFQAANEEVFATSCDLHFGGGGGRETSSTRPATFPNKEESPLRPNVGSTANLVAPSSSLDTKADSKSADPVVWAMQHMDLEGSKAESKPDSAKGSDGHFPLPTGRPGRPPALARPPVRIGGGGGGGGGSSGSTLGECLKPSASSVTILTNSYLLSPGEGFSAAAMRPFDRSNPPPVTITGVAPWAMTGASGSTAQIGGDRSTAMGISTTAMPGTRAPVPFNPSRGSRSSGAPPNSLSCTIQEARQARTLAEAKNSAGQTHTIHLLPILNCVHILPRYLLFADDGVPVQKHSSGDGLARIIGFMQRCMPEAASRSAEEEEAARLQDWRTVQAAVSPSLLPDLKFHDLVFGTVLGEGAFSVVKYARQIVKVMLSTVNV